MLRAIFALGMIVGPWAVPSWVAAQTAEPKLGDAVYAYTDDRGRLIHTHRLSDVPEALRPSAQRVDRPELPAPIETPLQALWRWFSDEPAPIPGAAVASSSASLYRYRSREGRVVFTNLAASVPTDQQHNATLDLQHVSVNSALGRELDSELKTQYDLLAAAPFCQDMRAALQEPLWQRLWNERRPLLVCGLAILAFVVLTPWVVRRVGGAAWARTLSYAIPVLAFVGVSATLLMQTGRSLSELRSRAQPCESDAWARAGQSQHPLVQHNQLVQALRTETAALEQIHAESL